MQAEKPKQEKKDDGDKHKKGKAKVGNRSVRVDIDKLDELMNLVSELIIAKNGLVSASGAESTPELPRAD